MQAQEKTLGAQGAVFNSFSTGPFGNLPFPLGQRSPGDAKESSSVRERSGVRGRCARAGSPRNPGGARRSLAAQRMCLKVFPKAMDNIPGPSGVRPPVSSGPLSMWHSDRGPGSPEKRKTQSGAERIPGKGAVCRSGSPRVWVLQKWISSGLEFSTSPLRDTLSKQADSQRVRGGAE